MHPAVYPTLEGSSHQNEEEPWHEFQKEVDDTPTSSPLLMEVTTGSLEQQPHRDLAKCILLHSHAHLLLLKGVKNT